MNNKFKIIENDFWLKGRAKNNRFYELETAHLKNPVYYKRMYYLEKIYSAILIPNLKFTKKKMNYCLLKVLKLYFLIIENLLNRIIALKKYIQ